MSGGYVVNEDGTLRKPETTMTEPVLNRAAVRFDAEGAELAARHYLALTEYAWATGDTGPMREFATDECEPCAGMADDIDALYAGGGWATSGAYNVLTIERIEALPNAASVFGTEMIVEYEPYDEYSSGELTNHPKKTERIVLFTQWDGPSWKVAHVGALENE